LFQITSETGVAAGIRRIEAVTGEGALDAIDQMSEALTTAATQLKTKPNALLEKITQLMQAQKQLKKELTQYEQQAIAAQSQGLFGQAVMVDSFKVLSLQLDKSNPQRMRTLIDQFKAQSKQGVIVLATVVNQKILLSAGVSKACADRIHAGHLLAYVAQQIDGKAGGRDQMAQGGGSNIAQLPKALDSVVPWVQTQIQGHAMPDWAKT
jgi:alanyl-tRNA synthetase